MKFRRTSVLSAIVLLASSLTAQSNPSPNNPTGLMPYQSYSGSHENINLATGDVNISIPLFSLPGRNGHDLSISMDYDSKLYYLWTFTPPNSSTPTYAMRYETNNSNLFGWRNGVPQLFSESVTSGTENCQTHYVLQTADGSKHPFPTVNTNCYAIYTGTQGTYWVRDPGSDTNIGISNDNSNIELSAAYGTTPFVIFPDGSRILFGGTTALEDTNGNQITNSASAWTDTVGR